MPRVFISYSSDSDAHKERVKNFADFLVDNGIDIEFDQYTPSPQYGWPEYMVDSIEKSDFVLCVCTKEYKLRFENKAPIGKGKGAKFEGKIIADIVYEQEYNSKFLPIIFDKTDSINIPRVIHPDTYYCVDSQQGMLALYARLTNQPLVNKPKLGKIVSLDIFRNESQKTAMPENSDARKQQYSKSEIRSLLKEELAHLRGRETLFSSEIVIRDLFDK